MKKINSRCPLQQECGRKICEYQYNELQCDYYKYNGIGDNIIPDQEEIRKKEEFLSEDDIFEEINKESNFVMLPLDSLVPHPDNPRKDVGDVSELAESIKESGILQNLTVVPHEGKYRVIIGHRRMTAAKLAGLTEVPCYISDMDYKTQVATMLSENMQRVDLTIPEQVEGIQMMLNLGEDIDYIKKKTGFSDSTVRQRLKMAELDKNQMRAASERGATIADFVKLEKIKDIRKRNKVLMQVGTREFNNAYEKAIQQEAANERRKKWRKYLESFAAELSADSDTDGYKFVKYLSVNATEPPEIIPEDAETVEYYFILDQYNSRLLRKPSAEEVECVDKAELERKAKLRREREKKEQLEATEERFKKLRRDFVNNYVPKDQLKETTYLCYKLFDKFANSSYHSFSSKESIVKEFGEESGRLFNLKKFEKNCAKVILMELLTKFHEETKYRTVFGYYGEFNKNNAKTFESFYYMLESLGYEISEEERQFYITGKHELYVKDGDDK